MNEQENREKVIKGLECCISGNPAICKRVGCPYAEEHDGIGDTCIDHLMADALALLKAQEPITGETSDGYHTFNELYHHRAVLFSVIVANYKDRAWKSVRHHDGTMYDGMFIVGIDTPDGQATYHYDIDPYWGMFNCRVLDNAPEWDGHTPAQAIERIGKLKAQEPKIISLRDVVCADVGNVIWLETYYDGKTGIEPFLVHIDFTQKPVIINGWDSFYNISEQELNEDIVNSFADGFTVRKFRFWNVRPTEEQRKAVKWE